MVGALSVLLLPLLPAPTRPAPTPSAETAPATATPATAMPAPTPSAVPALRLLQASATQAWTQRATLGAYTAMGHYPSMPMSSPAVGDVTGDGVDDVVVGNMDGFLRVYRADTGALEASVPLEGPIQSSPLLVDLYGGGRPEVVVSSASVTPGNTSSVRVLSFSPDGTWWSPFNRTSAHPVLGPTVLQRPFLATPAVGDIDGDGQPEIVAANLDQHLYAWNLDGSQVFAPKFLYDTLLSSPTLVDWNGDGRAEIVFGGDMGPYPGSPYPAAKGLLWSVDGTGNVSPGYPIQIPDQVLWTPPTVTDLNGDGAWDVVLGTGMNYPEPGGARVYAYTLATRQSVQGFPVAVAGRTYSAPLVVPLNGVPTVLVGTGRGWLYSITRDGHVRWRRCTTRFTPCTETGQAGAADFLQVNPAVADIDGDGALEAVVTTEKDLKFYDLLSGAPENFTDGATRDAPVTVAGAWPNAATPSIAAVGGTTSIFVHGIEDDGNGAIGVGDHAFLQRWTTSSPLGAAPWPTDKANMARTGLVCTVTTSTAALRSFAAAATHDFLGREATESEKATFARQVRSCELSVGSYLAQMVASDAWLGAVVTKFYTDTLGRQPEAAGLSYWVGILRSGRLTVAQVASAFYASDEYYTHLGGGTDRSWVTELYRTLLHREPEATGLDYWAGLARSAGRTTVVYSFYQSQESCETRVTGLYQTLLGRAPDPGGLSYWAGLLPAQGDLALALNLASSAEYFGRATATYPQA